MPDQSLKQNQYKDTTSPERNAKEIRKKYEKNTKKPSRIRFVMLRMRYNM